MRERETYSHVNMSHHPVWMLQAKNEPGKKPADKNDTKKSGDRRQSTDSKYVMTSDCVIFTS